MAHLLTCPPAHLLGGVLEPPGFFRRLAPREGGRSKGLAEQGSGPACLGSLCLAVFSRLPGSHLSPGTVWPQRQVTGWGRESHGSPRAFQSEATWLLAGLGPAPAFLWVLLGLQ